MADLMSVQEMRAAGFNDAEISQYLHETLPAAGFADTDIQDYMAAEGLDYAKTLPPAMGGEVPEAPKVDPREASPAGPSVLGISREMMPGSEFQRTEAAGPMSTGKLPRLPLAGPGADPSRLMGAPTPATIAATVAPTAVMGPVGAGATLLNMLARGGIAAAAGGGTEYADTRLQGGSPNIASDRALKEGAIAGLSEFVPGVAGKGVARMLAPAAGKITDVGRRGMELAEKYKLPIGADRFIGGAAPWLTRQAVDNVHAGAAVSGKIRQELYSKMNDISSNAVKNITGIDMVPSQARIGERLGQAMADIKDPDKWYDGFNQAFKGRDDMITLRQMQRFINTSGGPEKWAKRLGFKEESGRELIKKIAETGQIPAKDVPWLAGRFYKTGAIKYKDLTETAKGTRMSLKDKFLADMDNYAADGTPFRYNADMSLVAAQQGMESLGAIKRSADTAFGETAEFLKGNAQARALLRTDRSGNPIYEMHPKYIVQNLIAEGRSEDLKSLAKFMTDNGKGAEWELMIAGTLDDMIQGSTKIDPVTSELKFMPGAFAQRWEKIRERFGALVPEEMMKKIDEFADAAKIAGKEYKNEATPMGRKAAQWLTAGLGYQMGGPVGVAAVQGGSAALAYGLMSRSSMNMLRKYLTRETMSGVEQLAIRSMAPATKALTMGNQGPVDLSQSPQLKKVLPAKPPQMRMSR